MLALAAMAVELVKAEAARVKYAATDVAVATIFLLVAAIIVLAALGLATACAFLLLAPAITAPGALGILAGAYLLIGLILFMVGKSRANRHD